MSQDGMPETHQSEGDGSRVTRRGVLGAAAGGVGLAALLQAANSREAKAQTSREGFFALEVEGVSFGAFIEVSGIGSESAIAGRDPKTSPSKTGFDDIVLKRGISSAVDLWDWRKIIEEGGSDASGARKNGSIILFDQSQTEVARWNFEQAWPKKLEGGHSKLLSDDVMILEQVTLVHESITRAR